MLKKLFHVAINSTDLDRSVEFYKMLGFSVLQDRTVENPAVARAFNVPGHRLRFVHLRLGDSEDATVLDIVQWYDPPTEGEAVKRQHQRGITRFAVLTDDAEAVYQTLKARGVPFVTTPTEVMTPQGGWKVCLAEDPDGVVVQITQLLPAPGSK